jgi:hypothetical protein
MVFNSARLRLRCNKGERTWVYDGSEFMTMHKSLVAILFLSASFAFGQAGNITHVDPNHRTATQKQGLTTGQTENKALNGGQSQAAPNAPGVIGFISDSKCKCIIHTEQPGLGAAGSTRYAVDHGASYVLVSNDKVYALNGDKKLFENFAGEPVRVEGAVSGSAIQVKNISPARIPGMVVTPEVRQKP